MNIYLFKLEAVSALAIFALYYATILNKDAMLISSIDSLTRIDLNLPYYNSLYFLWTNLDYIYLYFIAFIYFALLFSFRLSCLKNYTTLMPFIFIFTVSITLHVASTSIYSQFSGYSNNTNLLLFNSINKYHPLLLYIPVVILIFLSISYSGNIIIRKTRVHFNKASAYWVRALIIITSTMYAGSWWAYQEGSWGGWWAWDSSETFGLLILLLLLGLAHLSFFLKKVKLIKYYYYVIITLILLNYLVLQLNFGITSHNFGLKDSSDSTITDYYIKLVILLSSAFVLLVHSYTYKSLARSFFKKLKVNLNYYVFLLVIPIFTSLAPLLTDLLWKLYELNTVNFNSNYYLLSSLLVSIVFQWFNYPTLSKLAYLVLFIILYTSNHFFGFILLSFFIVPGLTKFSKVHICVFFFLYASWASNNYIVNHWIFDICYSATSHINLSLLKHPLLVRSELSSLYDSTYSILSDSSTTISNGIFFLNYSISECQQVFLSDNTRINLISKTFDDLTFLLSVCFYIILNYMYRLLVTSYIIKC
jgi:cytochrome c biogenesis factor